ncbi:DEAD/DEAH box helicase [Roseiconus lacunae]|uniref:DEAD/DEAH box helicase n=1 Tax=Roseiconus lacunae TaxID=2605694 RepID=A0ABT7PPB0_9BACT|nr:DEAD/DEAH box helicase [Roseiconus lacunae]MDM4018173.1 DEAD/DEAH box helicase [Roseiconus lacunae]
MAKKKDKFEIPFHSTERLMLHQLRLLEWMATTGRKRFVDDETDDTDEEKKPSIVPEEWELTRGIDPYDWQQKCIANWFANDGHGTVKVVTGGGKTLLAMAIAERVQNEKDRDLRLAIVVPTIVLMHQWYDALLEHGNLPKETIGRLGDNYKDDFGNDRRVLITVLASARTQLPRVVKKSKVGKHLMLVADECHRAGAKEMSRIFKAERRWSLGLSATPEREDDDDAGYDESLVGKEVGPIIYEFNLADALREGLVPKFTINHYGLPMKPDERTKYEALSRSITDSMSKLRSHRDGRSSGDFFSWARNVASRNKGEIGAIAMRFVSDTSKRRELLNHMDARHDAVQKLIEQEFAVNKDARVILFHESINEVMHLYLRLRELGLPVIAEHSELPGSIRETGLELFRRGTAQIIMSARSLIEGFNVPAVDVGIIVASSGSVRQRIQSLGRVLRRHRGKDGEEKTSCIHVLYAEDSSEEHIYGKVSWDETTGVEQNRYWLWDIQNEPAEQDGPPQTPLPTEMQVDAKLLEPGSVYPGQYEGIELSCDTQMNVRNNEDQYARDTRAVADAVIRAKGGPGKFKVTPKQRFVLVRIPVNDDWETKFVMQLEEPLRFDSAPDVSASNVGPEEWAKDAAPGDAYPFGDFPTVDDELRFKRKSGGIISKKVKGGEMYARNRERAANKEKGSDADYLVASVQALHNGGRAISKIEINKANHAVFREAGNVFFICALKAGLEFPERDDGGSKS